MSRQKITKDGQEIFPVFNAHLNDELDRVIPVNPETGLRDDIVHKYELSLTDSERAQLTQYMEVQDVAQPSQQLSDKDLIALCPSRYVSTLSDAKQLAKAMRAVVADLDQQDAVTTNSQPSTQPSSGEEGGETS